RAWRVDPRTAAAFDGWLPSFDRMIPPLLEAYDRLPAADSLRKLLSGEIARLRRWDERWGPASDATTLAVSWGEAVVRRVGPAARALHVSAQTYAATRASDADLLGALAAAADSLTRQFGSSRVPWGEVNRFQRLDDAIDPKFDDSRKSIPVPFTSGIWGSLASFGARAYPGTRKRYGSSGNSFVAVVEFGERVEARAVTIGGASGHPDS